MAAKADDRIFCRKLNNSIVRGKQLFNHRSCAETITQEMAALSLKNHDTALRAVKSHSAASQKLREFETVVFAMPREMGFVRPVIGVSRKENECV